MPREVGNFSRIPHLPSLSPSENLEIITVTSFIDVQYGESGAAFGLTTEIAQLPLPVIVERRYLYILRLYSPEYTGGFTSDASVSLEPGPRSLPAYVFNLFYHLWLAVFFISMHRIAGSLLISVVKEEAKRQSGPAADNEAETDDVPFPPL